MNIFLKELSEEQRCAMVGVAFDLCRSNAPSKENLAKIEPLLNDFCDEIGISQNDAHTFVKTMTENGGTKYAVKILRTVENKRNFGLIYPNLYSFVATIESPEGLEQLNLLYNDEFGYNDDDIKTLWDLYEIKDFRKPLSANPTEEELLNLVTNNKSFITLRKYFQEWIDQGSIQNRTFIVKMGYLGLISYPNIFLTESRAAKELKAAKECYEIWIKYDKDDIQKSINSEDSKIALTSKISILPPEKNILLKCDEFFMLHYLLMGLYDSYSNEELAKVNGDDYAKVWLNIFDRGYHFGDTDKEYEADRNHYNAAFLIISNMQLSPEFQEKMNLEKIKERFNHYYHLYNTNSGNGCMVFIAIILTTSLMIACTL